jgi:hypothetical protein
MLVMDWPTTTSLSKDISTRVHIFVSCRAFMKKILVAILILTSCSDRDLTMKDLVFPDFERPFISKNNIDSTIYFGKNPYVKYVFGNNIPAWDSIGFLNWKFQPVGYLRYDSVGHLIEDNTERFDTFKYGYDSLGILSHRNCFYTDIRWIMNSTYKFSADSLTMNQYWSLPSGLYYTSRFKFNAHGYLIEEFNDDRDNTGGITRTTLRSYEYIDGRLVKMTEQIHRNRQLISRSSLDIYYDKYNILDSSVLHIDSDTTDGYSDSKGKYTMVTYYDSVGLRSKSILKDTLEIRYRHVKRSGT